MNLYRLAKRLERLYCMLFHPLSLGVRVIVESPRGEILLVRHKSDGLFYLPGGGVKKGETLSEAAARELFEECGIAVAKENLKSASVYTNFQEYKNDHIALFTAFSDAAPLPGPEVRSTAFYLPGEIPADISKGMKRRIDEYRSGEYTCGKW